MNDDANGYPTGITGTPDRHHDHNNAGNHDSWQPAGAQVISPQPQHTSNKTTTQDGANLVFVRCPPQRDVIRTTTNANSLALPSALGSQDGGIHNMSCTTTGRRTNPERDHAYPPAAEHHQIHDAASPRRPGFQGSQQQQCKTTWCLHCPQLVQPFAQIRPRHQDKGAAT